MHQWYRILALLCAFANAGNAQVFWQSDFGPWGRGGADLIPVGPLLQMPDQRIIAALPLSDELREHDTAGNWEPLLSGEVPFNALARSNSGNLLAATDGQGVLISMDGGGNWNTTTGGEPTVNTLLRLRDGRVLAGGQTGLYESRDDGINWTRLRSTQEWSIECLLERGNGEILLGGEAGIFIASADLQSWRAARPSWTPVMTLAEDGSGRLFAGTVGEGLFRSTDGGGIWEAADFEGQWITGIVTAGASYCFVATRQEGIFESRDGGSSWNPYSEGLRSNEILDLISGVDGYLYAGTVRGLSRSAWRVLSGGYLTPDFTLEQNTPNPASNTAVFAWSIPRDGNVRMSVYDLLGREIAVVLNAIVVSGLHWQTVETSELIPGSYFLVLRFEGQMLDRKFQVVR
ncbi:MAG: T9SS type A sorting domain-containing protein [Bacteroidetes bacterium]|nr:T9SS type A sorting domain-containing protein [Bacteroidota bacterium]